MNCILKAAKIIRQSIFELRKNKSLHVEKDVQLSVGLPAEQVSHK